MNIKNKICIVTGAGKGIGRETAKLFYKEKASLALITRTAEDVEVLKNDLNSDDSRVLYFVGDVSKEEDVVKFIDQTIKKFGRIDVLVNNAGMRFRKEFLKIETGEWDKVIANNLTSVYYLCRHAGKHMVAAKKGSIVNMASIIGTSALPELTAYGATKGGLITLTKCLALEWAAHNIRVNAIAPGFCETSYAEDFKRNKKDLYEFTLNHIMMRRWGSALEVANVCLFLASDDSSYITGETINVDGGWQS